MTLVLLLSEVGIRQQLLFAGAGQAIFYHIACCFPFHPSAESVPVLISLSFRSQYACLYNTPVVLPADSVHADDVPV